MNTSTSTRRREYQPKPLDPGQPVSWTRATPGHWTGEQWGDGEWVPGATTERTGVIWSAGPHPRGLWVTPDDAPDYPVQVTMPTPKRAEQGAVPGETMTAEAARLATQRAENVRQRGVYSVVQDTRPVRGSWPARTENVYRWHADPDCPDAAGKDRAAGSDPFGRYSARGVLAMLTGETTEGNSPSWLCRRCVWLDPQAEHCTDREAS
jgi:hypothetical protein